MKIGRNELCPCGSGKKYKKCCMSKTNSGEQGNDIVFGREEHVRRELIKDLIIFYSKNCQEKASEKAHLLYWGDFIPEDNLEEGFLETALMNFIEYTIFDFILDEKSGDTIIDIYKKSSNKSLEGFKKSKSLNFEEKKLLDIFRNSYVSLYEVQRVYPDRGFLFKDILTGKEFDIREKLGTKYLSKWDIIAVRLLYIDGDYIMSTNGYLYPLIEKQNIVNFIKSEYREYKKSFPVVSMEEFLKNNTGIFARLWVQIKDFMEKNFKNLKIRNTDGEILLFSRAIFEVKDNEAVYDRLKALKDIEYNDRTDKFTLVDYTPGRKLSSTINAIIEIKNNRLTIECNSKERLEKAKKMLLQEIPDYIKHRGDIFEDAMQAIKALEEMNDGVLPDKTVNQIPLEVQQEAINQMLTQYYEKWLNDKIPALDDKTPLEAIKTKKGKKQVIELLKFYENNEEKNKNEGKPYFDFSWLWEKLKLERT